MTTTTNTKRLGNIATGLMGLSICCSILALGSLGLPGCAGAIFLAAFAIHMIKDSSDG